MMAGTGKSTMLPSCGGDVCSAKVASCGVVDRLRSKKRKSNLADRAESRRSLRLSAKSSVKDNLSVEEDDDVAIESPVRFAFGVGDGKTYHDEYANAPEGERRAPLVAPTHLCCGTYEYPDKTLDCVALALSSFNEKSRAQQGPEAKPTTADEKPKPELFFAEVKYGLREDGKVGPSVRCCCILGPMGIKTGLRGCKLQCKTLSGVVQHPKDGFTKRP